MEQDKVALPSPAELSAWRTTYNNEGVYAITNHPMTKLLNEIDRLKEKLNAIQNPDSTQACSGCVGGTT